MIFDPVKMSSRRNSNSSEFDSHQIEFVPDCCLASQPAKCREECPKCQECPKCATLPLPRARISRLERRHHLFEILFFPTPSFINRSLFSTSSRLVALTATFSTTPHDIDTGISDTRKIDTIRFSTPVQQISIMSTSNAISIHHLDSG